MGVRVEHVAVQLLKGDGVSIVQGCVDDGGYS